MLHSISRTQTRNKDFLTVTEKEKGEVRRLLCFVSHSCCCFVDVYIHTYFNSFFLEQQYERVLITYKC